MNQATGTTFDQHEPALLISKEPIPLKYLQNGSATNGQVITFSSSAKQWQPANAVSTALTDTHIFVGNAGNLATDVAVSKDLTMANTGAATVVGIQGNTIIAGPYTAGDLFYFDGTFWNHLPIGTNGQTLTVVAGLPAWA